MKKILLVNKIRADGVTVEIVPFPEPGPTYASEQEELRELVERSIAAVPSAEGLDSLRLKRYEGAKKDLRNAAFLTWLSVRQPHLGTKSQRIMLHGSMGAGLRALGRGIAAENPEFTFFDVNLMTLTATCVWLMDAAKFIRKLFEVALEMKPSIVFLGEMCVLAELPQNTNTRGLISSIRTSMDKVRRVPGVLIIGGTSNDEKLDCGIKSRFSGEFTYVRNEDEIQEPWSHPPTCCVPNCNIV